MVATRHKAIKLTPDNEDDLLLCKGFKACQAAGVLISEACACCRSCSNQIMWRVELCPECRGSCTGYAFYHVQAADKAVRDGSIRLFFGYFTEEASNDQILEVGHRVSKTLKAAGLSVVWAEDASDTIMIKDLTAAERRYINNKMGPEDRKFAKWAKKMTDQMGPVSGGEIHHDCECMEFTCFCGQVTDLAEAQRLAYGSPSEQSTEENESEWTDCSESELAEVTKQLDSACHVADCGCAAEYHLPESPGNSADASL